MYKNPESNPFDLVVDFLAAMRRFWLAALLLIILCAVGMAGMAKLGDKAVYTASATLEITSDSNHNESDAAAMLAATFPDMMASKRLLNPVLNALDKKELSGVPSATQIEKMNILTISVRAAKPQVAYEELCAIVECYPTIARSVVGTPLIFTVQQRPQLPDKPQPSPGLKKQAILGALFGFCLALVLLFLYAITRTTIRRRSDFRRYLDVDLLGVLPPTDGETPSEPVRSLRVRLTRAMGDKKILLLAGMTAADNSHVLANQLARSYAASGQKTVIFHATPAGEKASYLKDWDEAPIQDTDNANLFELFNGGTAEQSSRALSSAHTAALIQALRSGYDRIILDGPSYWEDNDWSALLDCADGVVLVLGQSRQTRRRVMAILGELRRDGAQLLGGVLSEVRPGLAGLWQLEPRKR